MIIIISNINVMLSNWTTVRTLCNLPQEAMSTEAWKISKQCCKKKIRIPRSKRCSSKWHSAITIRTHYL